MVTRKFKFTRRFPSCQLFPTTRIPLTLAAHQAGSLFTYAWLWQHLTFSCPVFTMATKGPSASPAGGDTPKRARKTHTLEERLEVLDRAKKVQRNKCYSGRIGHE
ncbi:hypothetical protein E2C01_057296 [Portunus trituberculatus]|uniref:Uncharacterized protein n=1 Tax=Portunus trituberculatus TaxID=210409 RepID=A0A5B7GWE6_PORTR|nr:hypothetical protein [Portunus trituberculatus]